MTLSNEHIVSDPDICFGKPRIAGTRLAVKDVVAYHYYQRMSVEEIATDWNLSLAAVYDALAYYHDHKDDIDRVFAEEDALRRRLRTEQPSVLDSHRH
jgi:uncharacterized protein (DUF433 family)